MSRDVVILGGNSAANQGWVRALAATLASDETAVIPHTYRHWETGEELIDLDAELQALRQVAPLSDRTPSRQQESGREMK